MTAKHSILVLVARYQGAHNGGGVAVASHVLEYADVTSAQHALMSLAKARDAGTGASGGRFIIDAIPLWS